MLNCRDRQKGVSLVEVMAAMAIVALVLALAAPGLSVFMTNQKVRNGTESIQRGLSFARIEAMRRNEEVRFVLASTGDWTATTASGGVTLRSGGADPGADLSLGFRNNAGAELTAPATVTFNAVGSVTGNDAAAPLNLGSSMAQVDVDSSALDSADTRDLRVLIFTGGSARQCDPAVTSTTDPRRC